MCDIPKSDGKTRTLGIPTVSDRIAQMVGKMVLEPKVEPDFLEESYGYRPGKSALDAVGKARERCWKFDWIIDLDIRGYFDSIDHELMMHSVRKYTEQIEFSIANWAMRKYKKLHRKFVRTIRWLASLAKREPELFVHWNRRLKTAEQ
ncbi:hypothetical protein HZA55_08690 [Candidatus Poribacteria bacterium]|nr:hypothetical protein [Candidatus Poribacteria bacterium]